MLESSIAAAAAHSRQLPHPVSLAVPLEQHDLPGAPLESLDDDVAGDDQVAVGIVVGAARIVEVLNPTDLRGAGGGERYEHNQGTEGQYETGTAHGFSSG